ncbi:MAG: hypothetical protein CMF22_11785 [Idiomarinaceae bacterium]|nr:hypothetical protein [Idiomarinaceae bacterium]|tara:strand:+ start:42346 stop:42867 length:522 start_codon:yes stop_codon:yes gene_type:complete
MELITPQYSLQMGVNDWLGKKFGGTYKSFRDSQPVRDAFTRRLDAWVSSAGKNRAGMEGRSDTLDIISEHILDGAEVFWGHLEDAVPICVFIDSTLEMNLPIPSLMVVIEVYEREKNERIIFCLDMGILPETGCDIIKELRVTDRDPLVIFFGEDDRRRLWEELTLRIAIDDL